MSVDFARPEDIPDIADLWVEAFPGKRTLADRVRMLETGGRYGGLETVLVTRDANGRLAGACKIYSMTQYLAGAPMPMMGLAAVAVAPHARRRGLGATLCAAAIHEARARGDLLSTLYPFRPSYYERLGWGLVGHLLRYRFRTAHLPLYDEARHVRPARSTSDAEAIAACYGRVASRANGPIARDRRIWGYRLSGEELGVRPVDQEAVLAGVGTGEGKDRAVVFDEDGITGYAILRSVPGRSTEDATIQVRELVAEHETAYRGLLGHIASQRDQWPLGVHFARPDERFADRLDDPRPPRPMPSRSLYFPTATRVEGPMLRVLDVPAALAARPLAEDATFTVEVTKPPVEGNGGRWRVTARPAGTERPDQAGPASPVDRAGRALHAPLNTVEPEGGRGAPAPLVLSTDMPTLARIFAGAIPPSAAARIGRAQVRGDAVMLDRAFATDPFWLLDEF